MAGETPGANRARRKLHWKDNSNTDKYYASGQPSAINPSYVPPPTPAIRPSGMRKLPINETNADKKYYAADPQPLTREQLAAQQQRQQQSRQKTGHQFQVLEAADARPVLDEVVQKLQEGAKSVVVEVDAALLGNTRTLLDSLVTRGILSEDQARDIKLSRLPGSLSAAKKTPPEPRGVKEVEDLFLVDPAAFLAGTAGDLDDPVVDTTPQQIIAVDEHGQPVDDEGDYLAVRPTALRELPPEVTSFLDQPEAAAIPESAVDEETAALEKMFQDEAVASEPEQPKELDKPKRSGRRSGRGS